MAVTSAVHQHATLANDQDQTVELHVAADGEQARMNEEVLAHTYLALVSAVFLPFLVIRLLQQFKATR